MKIEVPPGKYVVAVSGGVDSMVLLDLLSRKPGLNLIVAHYDHGIRPNSYQDAEFVEHVAGQLGLKFELAHGKLGRKASEETARKARYKFLGGIKDKYSADSILTAHHQDDLIETALINILRGTGPQGLVSLANKPGLKRPLLKFSKKHIQTYAKDHRINWREDSTNATDDYLRNYLRHNVISKMVEMDRDKILSYIDKVAKNRQETRQIIATLYQKLIKNDKLDRSLFAALPRKVGNELLLHWFKQENYSSFDKKTIERTNDFIRTAKAGARYDVSKELILAADKSYTWLCNRG